MCMHDVNDLEDPTTTNPLRPTSERSTTQLPGVRVRTKKPNPDRDRRTATRPGVN